MTFYVTDQNLVVLFLFALGAILGVLYDAFVIKRVFIKTPDFLLFVDDLLFCFISCVAFLMTIFITNYGYVRWYEVTFSLCGFALYRLTFSRILIKIIVFVIRQVLRAFTFAAGVLLSPVKFISRKLFALCKKTYVQYKIWNNKRRIRKFSDRRMKRDNDLARKGFRLN